MLKSGVRVTHMECIVKIRNLKIEYIPDSIISLDIEQGEIVALVGPNGSGKSTLGRYIAGLIKPEAPDQVVVNGLDTSFDANLPRVHRKCGIVLQNPDDNYVFDMVSSDIMFGLENLNVPADKVLKRSRNVMKKYGLLTKASRDFSTLSGGEKQREAVAAIVAMQPKLLVLDEVFSMQSEKVRDRMLSFILDNARKKKQTLVIITQDKAVANSCDRIISMQNGCILDSKDMSFEADGTTVYSNAIEKNMENDTDNINETDVKTDIYRTFRSKIIAFTRHKRSKIINKQLKPIKIEERILNTAGDEEEDAFISGTKNQDIRLDKVDFSYGGMQVLSDISYSFKKGRLYIIKGLSASGKSTLSRLLNGLLLVKKGGVYVDGYMLPVTKKSITQKLFGQSDKKTSATMINGLRRKVGYVSQFSDKQLFADTVLKDVMFGPKNMGYDNDSAVKTAKYSLQLMGVDETIWNKPVTKLSGGEKKRVAIAGILAIQPEYLILDEADAGLDEYGIKALSSVCKHYIETGKCVIIVGH